MPMQDDILPLEPLLEELDAICRHAFRLYRSYPPEILIEHDPRTAANCTYSHMLAEADRRLIGKRGVTSLDINGLKVWNVHDQAVIRFKRMDEDGRSRNYPTRQALAFDARRPLPHLPPPAIRMTVGYWLDPTQTEYVRTQIARPRAKLLPEWCAAIVTDDGGRARWVDVTRQRGFGP